MNKYSKLEQCALVDEVTALGGREQNATTSVRARVCLGREFEAFYVKNLIITCTSNIVAMHVTDAGFRML